MIHFAKIVFIIYRHNFSKSKTDTGFIMANVSSTNCQENGSFLDCWGVGTSTFLALKKNECLSAHES